MKTNQSIKNRYYDVLFYATAPLTKNKPFHLKPVEQIVLTKLIHYDSTNPKITYSNKVIAEHTFRTERQIESVIGSLKNSGYITTISHVISNGKNNIVKRRTININWDFIATILNEINLTQVIDESNSASFLADTTSQDVEPCDEETLPVVVSQTPVKSFIEELQEEESSTKIKQPTNYDFEKMMGEEINREIPEDDSDEIEITADIVHNHLGLTSTFQAESIVQAISLKLNGFKSNSVTASLDNPAVIEVFEMQPDDLINLLTKKAA